MKHHKHSKNMHCQFALQMDKFAEEQLFRLITLKPENIKTRVRKQTNSPLQIYHTAHQRICLSLELKSEIF